MRRPATNCKELPALFSFFGFAITAFPPFDFIWRIFRFCRIWLLPRPLSFS
jgi:hypothetical protein